MTKRFETETAGRVLLGSLSRIAELAREVDPAVDLYGRVKTTNSVAQKMLRNHVSAHGILDILGVRAVTEHTMGCYRLIRSIHLEFPVLLSEFDDYIAAPKSNGYRSLHTTVRSPCGLPIEIQVRTHAMHAHAERGGACHLRYKRLQATEATPE